MRNLRDGVRRRDQARIKRDAQRIYLARDAAQARRAFARFRFHWQSTYPSLVRRLELDLPELLTFPAAAVAQAAHHQRHRALLRRSPQAHPAHGPVHQPAERGANPLCHLLQIQRAVAKPHPPPFYTSSLTSPTTHHSTFQFDRDGKIEHARIAHSERLCGWRRPRTHHHPGHQCRSAKGRRIISL